MLCVCYVSSMCFIVFVIDVYECQVSVIYVFYVLHMFYESDRRVCCIVYTFSMLYRKPAALQRPQPGAGLK